MLTRWKLSNFKSIGQPVELEIKPLTLLAGVNSAGKSTLIQSVLLVAQTLAARDPATEIVLNGELVSLGTARDLWHAGSEHRSLQIHFDLKSAGRRVGVQTAFALQKAGQTESTCQTRLLWTQIETAEAAAAERWRAGAGLRLRAVDDPRSTSSEPARQSYRVEWGSPDVQREWESHMFAQPWARLQQEQVPLVGSRIGVAQFLPRSLLVHAEPTEKERALRLERYLGPLRREVPEASARAGRRREQIPDPLKRQLERLTRRQGYSARLEGDYYQDYLTFVNALTQRQRVQIYMELSNFARDWVRDSGARADESGWDQEEPLPASVQQAVAEVRGFFARRLIYIPALRAEPKVLWNPDDRETWSLVGLHGERVAQALHRFGSQLVHYWRQEEGAEAEDSLAKALYHWLHYLELVDGVEALNLGKLGYRLNLKDGEVDRELDLTSIGLGVSQVLPILTAGLLMQPGDLMLVEQPEVHLHPRAQSRLGDFFLGLVRTGRQVLIETHSDHLTNRLFRRIAEARSGTNDVESLLAVYFAERKKGETTFLRVRPNQYGIVEEWPAGFFDEGALEAQAHLDASLGRRMSGTDRDQPA